MATNPFTIPTANADSTIAVGNLTDLAGILTNLTPEQLQNIQLDPALFEALSKTIEPTAIPQQTFYPAQELGQQQQQQEFPVNQTTVSNVIINQPVSTGVPLGNVNLVVSDSNGQLISSCPVTLISSPQKSMQVAEVSHNDLMQLQSPVNHLVAIDQQNQILAAMQNEQQQQQMLQSLQQTQNLLQQSQQLQATTAALQGFQPGGVSSSLILTPTVMSNVQPTATLQTVNLTDGTVAHIQTQPAAGLQGILPGESSSLILTPTVMSQVQPTATLQTINLTDGTVTNIPQSDMNQILMTQPGQVSSDGGIQTITLNQDQLGLTTSSVQIPISTTILPSTITIDPNLFKKPNNNLNPLTAQNIQFQQSPTAVFNNQSFGGASSVIVDSNLINALTSNNLQSVNNQLLSDMIVANQQQGGVITMPKAQPVNEVNTSQKIQMMPISLPMKQQTQQTVKKFSNQQQQQPARNFSVATGLVAPPRTTIKTIKIPGVSPVKRKQTIQSIQNFSPDSAIFKDSKKTGQSTVSSTSLTPSNVTIKKKINVIKKSNVIPVKPTSVEQVQPGVFKLQLKKVSSAEATALLSKKTISSKSGKVEHSLTSLINTTTGSPVTDLKNIGRSAMQMSNIKGGGVTETSLNDGGIGTKASYGGVNHQTVTKTPTHTLAKSPQQVVIKDTKKVATPVSCAINGGKLTGRGGGVTTMKVSNLPKNVVNKIQDLGKYNVVKIASSLSAVAATSTISTKNNVATSSSTISTTPKETLKQVTIVNTNVAAMSPTVAASKVTVVKSQSTSYTNQKSHQIQSSPPTPQRSLQPQTLVQSTVSTTVTSSDDTSPTTTTPNNPTQSIVLPKPPRVKFPTVSPAFLRATLEAKKAAASASTKPTTTTPSKMSPVVVVAGKERSKIVSRLSTNTVMPIVKNKQNPLSPPSTTQSGAALLNSPLSPPSASSRIVVTNNNNNKMKAVTAAAKLKPKVVITKATSSIPGNVSTTTVTTNNTTRSTTTTPPTHRQKSPITSTAAANTTTTNKTKNSTMLSSPTSSAKEQDNSLECQERGFVVSPVGCLEEDITTLSSEVDIDATLKALPKIPFKSASSSSSMDQANAILQKAKQTCSLSSSASPRSQRGHHNHVRSPEGSSSSTREQDEVEIIREAIESSRVGQPAEINMRELAKLEITKQFRRCKAAASSTTTNATTASVSTASGIKRKTTANSNSTTRKKSTATTTAIPTSSDDSLIDVTAKSDIGTDDRISTSISAAEEVLTPADLKRKLSDGLYSRKDTNKTAQQSDDSAVAAVTSVEKKSKIAEDIISPPKKDSAQQQRSRNKASGRRKKKTSSSLILDESRKRERPKKFDDFVLATENKQQQAPPLKKEKKTKKFFFPKEQEVEKKQDSTKNQETGNAKNSKDTNINQTVNNDSSSGSSLKTEGTTTDSETGNMFSDNKTKSDLSTSASNINTSAVLADDEDDDGGVDIDNKTVTSANSESATSSKTTTTAANTTTEKPSLVNKNSEKNSQNATPSATTASSSSSVNTNKTNSSMKMKISSTATSTSASKKKQTQSKTKNTKTNANNKNKNNKRRKKKQPAVSVELEELPEHLKKAKAASASVAARKMEDTVIDVTKVKLRSSFTETSFVLNDDSVEPRTFKLINRKNWVCTLCGRPGNLGTLDVLFGPYKIAVGGGPPSTAATITTDAATKNNNNNKENTPRMNVWLHRDCAVWTSNICLANQTLRGLGESLNEAALTKCCLCSQVGATLQCGFKKCRDGYHFLCAKQRGCHFEMENFTITCPKHR